MLHICSLCWKTSEIGCAVMFLSEQCILLVASTHFAQLILGGTREPATLVFSGELESWSF